MTRIPLDNPLITNGSLKKIEVSPDTKNKRHQLFSIKGKKIISLLKWIVICEWVHSNFPKHFRVLYNITIHWVIFLSRFIKILVFSLWLLNLFLLFWPLKIILSWFYILWFVLVYMSCICEMLENNPNFKWNIDFTNNNFKLLLKSWKNMDKN